MKTAVMGIRGELVSNENLNCLILHNTSPDLESNDLLYLRFAFVTRGKGGNIFPTFILDDWGREIRGLKLYDWVRENGEQFPRGEIFGFEEDGRDTQCFLRELELYARLPVYAFNSANQPVTEGVELNTIFLPDKSVSSPTYIARPQGIKYPLRSALVNWWQIPWGSRVEDLDLNHVEIDPGY